MKRKAVWLAAGLSLLLTGCAREQAQLPHIGTEAATQSALRSAGLTACESATAGLSTRNGIDYYHVELSADGARFQYDIDALTGVVINSTSLPAAAGSPLPASQSSAGETQLAAEEAIGCALKHAGLTRDQVSAQKIKLKSGDSGPIYNVKFTAAGSVEYDYEIDAVTGEVIRYDYEDESPPAASGAGISQEEAKALALSQVPGACAADIRDFDVDEENGRIEYEGKILYGGMEYEFEIDGYSGAIRSWEAEPIRSPVK